MRPIAQLFNLLSVNVPESASIVAYAASPRYRREFLRRLGLNIYGRGLGIVGRALRERPTLVTDREWDCLIVLDACRYDTLAGLWQGEGSLRGELPYVISPGTTTLLWIQANFVANSSRDRMSDVTVAAGNPYISETYFNLRGWDYPFSRSIDVWKAEWDDELDTVHPREVFRATQDIGNERLLVHFLQPHSPFIPRPKVTWGKIEQGSVSLEDARGAYEDNLRLVLKWAFRLVESLEGKVVITSDHGELFGEFGLVCHTHSVLVRELMKVPWIELEGGERLSLK